MQPKMIPARCLSSVSRERKKKFEKPVFMSRFSDQVSERSSSSSHACRIAMNNGGYPGATAKLNRKSQIIGLQKREKKFLYRILCGVLFFFCPLWHTCCRSWWGMRRELSLTRASLGIISEREMCVDVCYRDRQDAVLFLFWKSDGWWWVRDFSLRTCVYVVEIFKLYRSFIDVV